jgi:hypothetical protein
VNTLRLRCDRTERGRSTAALSRHPAKFRPRTDSEGKEIIMRGVVTLGERIRLHQALNRQSMRIYDKKHN